MIDDLRSKAQSALRQWGEFPVDRDPRPLVLAGLTSLFRGGFPSSEAKEAFIHGCFAAAPDVPASILEVLQPGSTTEPVPPLLVVAADPASGTFMTDRGPLTLPAWRIEIRGIRDPFVVLAPELFAAAWPPHWDPERSGFSQWTATLARDGRTLTLHFFGSGSAEYMTEIAESPTAAVVLPIPRWDESRGGRGSVTRAVAVPRVVTTQLGAELGSRVLIEPKGLPIPVTVGAEGATCPV
jgi:hypothetical protein